MPKTTDTSSNQQKQAIRPQLIITQAMLAGLFDKNCNLSMPDVPEVATAMLLGCRIEPGPIKPSLETDQHGYQRLNLSKK